MFQIHQLKHTYQQRLVLDVPSWEAQKGQHWLLLGNSGSGKTTLLHLLGGLRQIQEGEIHIAEQDLRQLKESKLDRFRARNIGLVFQKPHLVATLTVLNNLLLAQYMAQVKQDKEMCYEILKQLNLQHRAQAYPHQLSQGEAQRVSVARALLNQPEIILADEPTASLDDQNAQEVVQLLKQQAEAQTSTLVIATHDQRVKQHFSLIYQL